MAKKKEYDIINVPGYGVGIDDGGETIHFEANPPIDKEDPDIFVAVNGVGVRIKKGEKVELKRKYFSALLYSAKADAATNAMVSNISTSAHSTNNADDD